MQTSESKKPFTRDTLNKKIAIQFFGLVEQSYAGNCRSYQLRERLCDNRSFSIRNDHFILCASNQQSNCIVAMKIDLFSQHSISSDMQLTCSTEMAKPLLSQEMFAYSNATKGEYGMKTLAF